MTSFDSSKPVKKKKAAAASKGGRIAKLLQNPGTRAGLADKYLSPEQLKQRQLNQRLNAPVTEGSSLTNRELAHQADNATQVQYGPAEQALTQKQTAAKDFQDRVLPAWYDEYQRQLAGARDQITNNNVNSNAAFERLSQAAGKAPTGVEGTGENDAASQAQGVRQQILGNFAALQNQAGTATENYATGLAGIVAPGQKLTALGDANRNVGSIRDQIAALLKEKGAANEKFRTDTVAGEQKNVLANQALGLNVAKAATQAKQNSPEGRAAVAAATSEATNAAKYGYSVHQWRTLGPDGRQRVIKASKAKPADSVYTTGAFIGRKKSDIEAMSDAGRQTLVDRYEAKHGTGAGAAGKTKSPYLGTGPQNTFKNSLAPAVTTVGKYKSQYDRNELRRLLQTGRPAQTVYVDANGKVLPNVTDLATAHKQGGHAVKVPAIPKITNDAALSAALDKVYDGHLSPATIKKLHAAGIRVNGLGISTKRPSKASQVADNAISTVGTAVAGLGG